MTTLTFVQRREGNSGVIGSVAFATCALTVGGDGTRS